MEIRQTRRFVAATVTAASSLAWLVLAVAAAPAAHAEPRGNSAAEAALAAERARQAGGTATPTQSQSQPQPKAAPATSPAPSAQAQPNNGGATINGTLDVGSSGDTVKAVEQRLDALHYFVGTVDSKYDEDTYQAVMAFQKVNGLDRTGKVDQQVWSAMQSATDPQPLVSGGASQRVEIDLNRQVLFLYKDGKLNKILPVSSGTAETPTPTGDYAIYAQSTGWETSPLGQLYNSQYFTGGYAIHGSKSVPAHAASHGCVRIPMTAADWFPGQVSIGTPVHIQ